MERFLDSMCLSVVAKQNKNEERFKDFVDDDGNAFVPEEYVDEYLEGIHDFPQFVFGGFIFSWYSFVEQKLVDLSYTSSFEDIDFDLSKCLKDQGIELARCIFRHFDVVLKEAIWQELIEIRNFRNRIVHHGYDIMYFSTPLPGETKRFKKSNGEAVYLVSRDQGDKYMESSLRYAFRHHLVRDDGSSFKIIPTQTYCSYLLDFALKLFGDLRQKLVD